MSKILVVDDEVQLRTLLSRMLELEGYEVCQAGDCRTALKQLEFQSPDVVLCDVFLPDGNGVDLVSSVKKTALNVEIILLTADCPLLSSHRISSIFQIPLQHLLKHQHSALR